MIKWGERSKRLPVRGYCTVDSLLMHTTCYSPIRYHCSSCSSNTIYYALAHILWCIISYLGNASCARKLSIYSILRNIRMDEQVGIGMSHVNLPPLASSRN